MSEGTADPTLDDPLAGVALDGVPVAPGGTGGRSPGRQLSWADSWRVARPLVNALVTLVVIIGLWWAFVAALNLDPLLAKTPADVWTYLIHGANSDGGTSVWGG